MLFHRLGLGFSPSTSNPRRRHCYVAPPALDELLETPGVLPALVEELEASREVGALSLLQQLEHLRRRAIHLAVTDSPWRGLSVEEILVLSAYASPRFDHTRWKQELLWQPSESSLTEACLAWLQQRTAQVGSGRRHGRSLWPLVGQTAADARSTAPFTLAVAPMSSAASLWRGLEGLGAEAGFAHEHYVACSPASALGYLALHARSVTPTHWDSLVLDRRLRTLGLGLLLVEPGGVLLELPARYFAEPKLISSEAAPPEGPRSL